VPSVHGRVRVRRVGHELGLAPPPDGPQRRLIPVQKEQEIKEDGRYIIFYDFDEVGEED